MIVTLELDEGHINGARYVDVEVPALTDPIAIQRAATAALVALRKAGQVAPWGCAGVHRVEGMPWADVLAAAR